MKLFLCWGVKVNLHTFFISTGDGGEWSDSRYGRLYPGTGAARSIFSTSACVSESHLVSIATDFHRYDIISRLSRLHLVSESHLVSIATDFHRYDIISRLSRLHLVRDVITGF